MPLKRVASASTSSTPRIVSRDHHITIFQSKHGFPMHIGEKAAKASARDRVAGQGRLTLIFQQESALWWIKEAQTARWACITGKPLFGRTPWIGQASWRICELEQHVAVARQGRAPADEIAPGQFRQRINQMPL